ncbi:uroporphyrinogen-III synthase [Flavobacterium pallidum]|uniref:Uroporphyrinogen-III synthase n=1 Tax=Flavobacterium pallidum TaxID=2172098 RepID=A0A2S1SF63_9FLAO|nr:uroporphyrinogen-III synthase [Flavobacterium pallidum]AWI25001.1 uroporphyrinogen-III synthase [Flavobacterium pallidum]
MTRVLSTKKLLPNQRQFLLNAGISVIEADFILVQEKEFTFTEIFDNLIFTSANAVKVVASHPDVQEIRRKPCFCVGEKTAALLDEVGFTVMEIVDNASALAEMIKKNYAKETFTFFCGSLRMETLPVNLKISGISFNEIEVYETVLAPKKINAEVDGLLFFSPSAVESYLAENQIDNQICFCIGATTAKALEQKTKNIVMANKPSVENVIIQTIQHFK